VPSRQNLAFEGAGHSKLGTAGKDQNEEVKVETKEHCGSDIILVPDPTTQRFNNATRPWGNG
jgi:hypothetical protein